MLIKSKDSIESRIKKERDGRHVVRRQLDVVSGLTKTSEPQRGDYKICREADKILKNYRNFKGEKDRIKITNEYFKMQKEFQKK